MTAVRAVVEWLRLRLGIDRPGMDAQAKLSGETLRRANRALVETSRLERIARSHR